jgi:hypothetical protein
LPATSYTPQLRPLSVGEMLDAGFRLFRHRFGTLVMCVLVPVLPLSIIGTLVVASTDEDAFDVNATSTTTTDSGEEWAAFLVTSVVQAVAVILAVAACYRVISAAYLGEPASVGSSLRFGISRVLPMIGAYIVLLLGFASWVLLIVVSPIFVLLFFLIVFLGVKTSVTFPAIIFERAGPLRSIGRSWRLTRGNWWRVFATLLVVGLISFVIYLAILVGFGAAVSGSDTMSEVTAAVLSTLVSVFLLTVLSPLAAAILTVIYYDLRVRNEGFDLQLLAQGVGAGTSRFQAAPERPAAPPVAAPAGPPSSGGFAPPEGSAPSS